MRNHPLETAKTSARLKCQHRHSQDDVIYRGTSDIKMWRHDVWPGCIRVNKLSTCSSRKGLGSGKVLRPPSHPPRFPLTVPKTSHSPNGYLRL